MTPNHNTAQAIKAMQDKTKAFGVKYWILKFEGETATDTIIKASPKYTLYQRICEAIAAKHDDDQAEDVNICRGDNWQFLLTCKVDGVPVWGVLSGAYCY